MSAKGRFVWFELMTTDKGGAKAFYSDLAGWGSRVGSDGEYEMWTVGKEELGGLMTLPEEARKHGAPPFWLGYVAVENLDQTLQQAQKLGSKLVVPATVIPQMGRFAVLADPQGAVFALYQGMGEQPAPDREGLGRFSWAELNTTDWKGAWTFYSQLFGWKPTQSMDMGPELGEYFMFGTNPEQSMGGMSNAANMMKAPAHWLHYFNVKDVDASVKRIQEMGGQVLNGPMDVPGGDRIAQCMDPQGAMFAIYSSGGK